MSLFEEVYLEKKTPKDIKNLRLTEDLKSLTKDEFETLKKEPYLYQYLYGVCNKKRNNYA